MVRSNQDETKRSAIIIAASSDIGHAISQRWMSKGWNVLGTYRTWSPSADELTKQGARLIKCDLSDSLAVSTSAQELISMCPNWDVLVLCPGALDPVGPFTDTCFDDWENSLMVNFTSQLRIIHDMLPSRRVNPDLEPCVLLFAGSGTNNAAPNYSAYTVSKIALIKMCELLDAEVTDTRFVIMGPGTVATKIHEPTMRAGEQAGTNFQRTADRLARNETAPMDRVVDCCDWIVDAPRSVVSGRNFSLVFDQWGTSELDDRLVQDPNMYKLRRFGNDWLVESESNATG